MKTLKAFIYSLLVITYFVTTYGTAAPFLYDYDSDEYCNEVCFSEWSYFGLNGDIRSKALAIMNMIDENKIKTKEKNLSILLEVELNILKENFNKKIKYYQDKIANAKQELQTSNNANEIKNYLDSIEREEKYIQILEGALHLTKQWKRDYCH